VSPAHVLVVDDDHDVVAGDESAPGLYAAAAAGSGCGRRPDPVLTRF
jgi:hypothetical protein